MSCNQWRRIQDRDFLECDDDDAAEFNSQIVTESK
jgi:hypothetical protein